MTARAAGSNPWLSEWILEPVDDKAMLGTRYCSGGSIFLIEDRVRGALLSGPSFLKFNNLFDGQGMPEAFQPHLPIEAGHPTGSHLLGIGIGLIDPAANAIVERCAWKTERDAERRDTAHRDKRASGGFPGDRPTDGELLHVVGGDAARRRVIGHPAVEHRLRSTLMGISGAVEQAIRWSAHATGPNPRSALMR